MCLQLLELDRENGDFLGQLERWGLDYEVVLTADHGGLDIPERLQAKGVADAAWVDQSLSPESLGQAVAASTGLNSPVIAFGGPSGDVFIDPALRGADRTKALNALLAAYRAHPQVEAVFAKDEIAHVAVPSGDPKGWSLIQRVRASFDADRSGDLYVVLKAHIMPITDTTRYVATHGSPWDYDRRVPILFWRKGMPASSRNDAADTVDIMPTLAAGIGLPIAPDSVDGHCLNGVPGISCPVDASNAGRGR
jgi:arylsulfatase A-like enzyme